jgi:predicted glycosyltransferase
MVPKVCEFVHIPSLDSIDRRKSKHWGRDPFLENDIARGRSIRNEILTSCMRTFQPHGFISDYLPLGKDHELVPLLSSNPNCRKYFVVRGILGAPEYTRSSVFTQPAMDSLRNQYDMILATCDERIVDIAGEYSLSPDLVTKLVYTGYAVEPYNAAACAAARSDRLLSDDATWVVCSAGGGKDGEDLIQRCWEVALYFPECYFDLIVGPRSRLSLLQEGWYGGSRIRVQQSDGATMPYRLGGADVVICRGGYNSLMETVVGNAHVLVAPIHTDYEQIHHARRLSAFRPLHLVDDIEDLDEALEHVLTLPKTSHQLADLRIDGLTTSARLILADLAQAAVSLQLDQTSIKNEERSLQ